LQAVFIAEKLIAGDVEALPVLQHNVVGSRGKCHGAQKRKQDESTEG
jgi:hypothetical protein